MAEMMERRRGKVAEAVAEFLRDSEVVQAAIMAQNKGSGAFTAFGARVFIPRPYWGEVGAADAALGSR